MDNGVPPALCDERTANILHKLDSMQNAIDATQAAIMDIRRLLLGNGQAGLFERVRKIEEWRREQMATRAAIRKAMFSVLDSRTIWKILVGALAGAASVGGAVALWL